MTIVTVAAYDWRQPRFAALLRMWVESVRRNLPDAPIIAIADVQLVLDGVQVIVGRRDCEHPILWNVGFKLFNLCQLDFPHVYLDLDCAVLGGLDVLSDVLCSKGTRYAAVPQPPGAGFNSGVYVAPEGMRWIDYEAVREIAFRHRPFEVAGYDQAALWHWFRDSGVFWKALPAAYNTEAGEVAVKYDGNRWRGIDRNGAPVHVSHYWRKKPWDTNCPMYNSFLRDEGHERTSLQGN